MKNNIGDKKGFVLIETIIVLIVVVISMLALYKAYSFVFQNMKQNKYYDNVNDVYKLNILKKAFLPYPDADKGYIKFDVDNCIDYMDSSCSFLFENLGVKNIIYISESIDDLLDNYEVTNELNTLTNTDINYIKDLESNRAYLIYHRYNNDEERDYYASLTMGVIK